MPENIRQQSLNSRRGLLLGMTLAEVMLIILFALLLLLGRQFIDLEEAKETLQNYATVISAGWSQNMSEKEVEALTGLIEETKKRQKPDEEISKTWETLTSNLEEESRNFIADYVSNELNHIQKIPIIWTTHYPNEIKKARFHFLPLMQLL